ncbi:MAG: protein kinase [Planctomycetota bacterium]
MLGEFGDYTIEAELSRGGMGVVYAARDRHGLRVALKVLHVQAGIDLARFRREAELLVSLRHPGIVGVAGFGVQGKQAYLVMDLVEGPSLDRVLRERGRLRPEVAARYALQVAEALAVAHAAGVVHRDLKPANLILDAGERIVIVDFGLAFAPEEREGRLTHTGEILGTPAYMAPEQAGTAHHADARSDVYGLGATLFALLTGQAPFGGTGLLEVLNAVLTQRAPSLRARGVAAPAWLEEVVRRCLEKEPERRFPDAGRLADALRAGVGAGGGRGRRAGAVAGLCLAALSLGVCGWALSRVGGSSAGAPPPPPPPPPAASEPQEHLLEVALSPDVGHDTYVYEWGLYNNDNAGASGYLVVGVRNERGEAGRRWALVQAPLDRLPSDAEVLEAELVLRLARPYTLPLRAYAVLEPWIEGSSTIDARLDGVVWGSTPRVFLASSEFERPALEEAVCARGVHGEGTLRFDLTECVRAWATGATPNYGVCLQPEAPPREEGTHFDTYYAREYAEEALRPRLRVRYRGAPPRPAPPAPVTPHLDRSDLTVLDAYLRARPADRGARVARARLLASLGDFGGANYDLQTASSQLPEGQPDEVLFRAACELCTQILAQLERDPSPTRYAPPLGVLMTAWSRGTPGGEPVPGPDVRAAAVTWRVLSATDVDYMVNVYARAQALWPQASELQDEVPRTALDVLERVPVPPAHALRVLEQVRASCALDAQLEARARALEERLRGF